MNNQQLTTKHQMKPLLNQIQQRGDGPPVLTTHHQTKNMKHKYMNKQQQLKKHSRIYTKRQEKGKIKTKMKPRTAQNKIRKKENQTNYKNQQHKQHQSIPNHIHNQKHPQLPKNTSRSEMTHRTKGKPINYRHTSTVTHIAVKGRPKGRTQA